MEILNFLFGGDDSSEDLTVNDFDAWGMNADWSDVDDNVFNDVTETSTGWIDGIFGLTNTAIDAYYDTQYNQAIRQAQLEQIALQNGVPKPTNVETPQTPVTVDNTKMLLMGGALLVGFTLLTRGK